MILPEKLQDWNYYVNKLPLYLQNSEGFLSHFRIWYDLLVGSGEQNGVLGSCEEILNNINVFAEDYVPNSDMLDKLGNIFGLSRNVKATYNDNGTTKTEYLTLDDHDFLLLIKAQIIKDYFDGSYVQAKEYYENAGLYIVTKNDDSPATLRVYLNDIPNSDYTYSDNVRKMFLSGMLSIKSMGIMYNYSIQDLNVLLIWDGTNLTYGWDGGQWAI